MIHDIRIRQIMEFALIYTQLCTNSEINRQNHCYKWSMHLTGNWLLLLYFLRSLNLISPFTSSVQCNLYYVKKKCLLKLRGVPQVSIFIIKYIKKKSVSKSSIKCFHTRSLLIGWCKQWLIWAHSVVELQQFTD